MKGEILPPLWATVHVQAGERRPAKVRSGFASGRATDQKAWRFAIRLWLPLFLLWLLLLPLLILALPILFIAALIFGIRFWKSLSAVFGLLAGSRGTEVEVENPGARIFVKLH